MLGKRNRSENSNAKLGRRAVKVTIRLGDILNGKVVVDLRPDQITLEDGSTIMYHRHSWIAVNFTDQYLWKSTELPENEWKPEARTRFIFLVKQALETAYPGAEIVFVHNSNNFCNRNDNWGSGYYSDEEAQAIVEQIRLSGLWLESN